MVVLDGEGVPAALAVHDDRDRMSALRLLMVVGGRVRCSSLLENVLTPQRVQVVWRGSRSVYTMRENALES